MFLKLFDWRLAEPGQRSQLHLQPRDHLADLVMEFARDHPALVFLSPQNVGGQLFQLRPLLDGTPLQHPDAGDAATADDPAPDP